MLDFLTLTGKSADNCRRERNSAEKKVCVTSDENYKDLRQCYRNLSSQLTKLRKDMDSRFELLESKMVTKIFSIASVIVPLIAINLAFLAFAVAAIMDIAKG